MSETQFYELECQLAALLASGLFLWFVVSRLRRAQPGLAIGGAIATAFFLRVLAAIGLNSTSAALSLRGGDEITFIGHGQALARWDFISTATTKAFTDEFHVWWFSLNYRVFDNPPSMVLRFEVIAFAVSGLALIAAAVYELAGPRAATITAWLLAFEPASLFFSGIVHKEPFMMLAEGLVAYGGARLWKRGNYIALVPMIAGSALAMATRPYAGWFLAAAAAIVALHAGLRRNSASGSFALSAVCIGLVVAFIPTVWEASSQKSLAGLQHSQDANAADTRANLSLERVDYSTREKVITNLPKRIVDVLTRPYPWQLSNVSQQMGAFGTLFLFGILTLLGITLFQHGRGVMSRAGPLVYPCLFLLAAYALSAGNAGTAFRYRTHVVLFLVAIVVVLRTHLAASRAGAEARVAREPLRPAVTGRSVPTLAR